MRRFLMAAFLSLCGTHLRAATVQVEVVDKQGRPVPDAVVHVLEAKGKTFRPPENAYIMDQVEREFKPHVLVILTGSRVRFPNKDDIHHHLYSFSDAKKFEVPLHKGKPAEPVLFDKPGIVKVGCNIHDWMSGVILVLPNPYFAMTDANGAAFLEVPLTGAVELAVFHERQRGEVKDTRRKVALKDGAKVSWQLALKIDFRKKRPAKGSGY